VVRVVPDRSNTASLLRRYSLSCHSVMLRRSSMLCTRPSAVFVTHCRTVRRHSQFRPGRSLLFTQVYISAPAESADTVVDRFISCVERIEAWISSNRLKMNADKTQIIWLGTRQQLAKSCLLPRYNCCLPQSNFLRLFPISVFLSTAN